MARIALNNKTKYNVNKVRAEVDKHKVTLDGLNGAGTANSIKLFKVAAGNGAGARTMTGAVVGDKVLNVWNVTDSTLDIADVETTITVADQIQQTATDHTSDVWLVFVISIA